MAGGCAIQEAEFCYELMRGVVFSHQHSWHPHVASSVTMGVVCRAAAEKERAEKHERMTLSQLEVVQVSSTHIPWFRTQSSGHTSLPGG